MIATAEEYLSKLWQVHNGNIPRKAVLLPSNEPIYEIDLNSRTIKAPYLSGIKKDQSAETFYFIVDRFHGEVDLTNTGCLVYYKNKTNGTGGFYPVPFYDITTFSTYVTNTYIEVELNDTNYKPNKFYIKNNGEEYVLATDDRLDKTQTYYEFNDTSKNRKYERVKLTEETYQPNMYYYFDNKGENPTLSYVLDERADFHADEDYYAYIEARYINAHVEYSNYKPRKYYLLQGDQFVLDIGPYNKEVDYYSLIDQPKILFPWTIKSPATDAAGDLEFAIRFYQVENYGTAENRDDRLVYNLGTKTALTRIQDTLDVEIKDEDFEDDANKTPENAPAYWQFLSSESATVLEDIYFRLSQLGQKDIYWVEASVE